MATTSHDLGDLGLSDWRAVTRLISDTPVRQRAPTQPLRAVWEAERIELYKRKLALDMEAIRLYEPIPLGDQLHRCLSQYAICDGSNRAGKSVSCAAEAAYAVLGCHPHGKYVKKNGLAWFVGLKEKHLILMYDSLFREGAFRVIRDEHTKLWRTLRWDRSDPTRLAEYDEAYKEKSKAAPPFIPRRMIATESMSDKAKGIPGVHTLRNGWKIIWSPGGGEPEQGQHWNFFWFDEEMTNPEFWKEAHRGATKLAHETELTRPRGVWSATSQVSNPELAELRDKAEREPESRLVRRYTFLIKDNPYISEADRQSFKEGLSEHDVATRYEGIPASATRRVYPSYNPMGAHGVEPFDIPDDWCIWAVTDPGRVRCGTLFDAVDPDDAFQTVYSGFEVRQGDAHEWARGMKEHETKMGRKFQGIVFDHMRGRQTLDSLYSKTVAEQYWEALMKAGVTPVSRGNVKGMAGFLPGLSNVEARERAMINMLTVRSDGAFEGTSRFRVVRGAVPLLDKQFRQAISDPDNPEKRYKHKNVPTEWIECAEYLVAFDPKYSPPQKPPAESSAPAFDNFKAKKTRARRRDLARSGSLYR
jgi:hypothetical protein